MYHEDEELNRMHEFMREQAEARRDVYSVYVHGWEGSMRVWYAPEFSTPEAAHQWIEEQGEWESNPRVELVYNY